MKRRKTTAKKKTTTKKKTVSRKSASKSAESNLKTSLAKRGLRMPHGYELVVRKKKKTTKRK